MNSDSVPVSTLAEIISDFLEEVFAFWNATHFTLTLISNQLLHLTQGHLNKSFYFRGFFREHLQSSTEYESKSRTH